MTDEHPTKQEIKAVTFFVCETHDETYAVEVKGVTRIEAFTKSGMHADIPYIRVWRGDSVVVEACQHNIKGVYFYPMKGATP